MFLFLDLLLPFLFLFFPSNTLSFSLLSSFPFQLLFLVSAFPFLSFGFFFCDFFLPKGRQKIYFLDGDGMFDCPTVAVSSLPSTMVITVISTVRHSLSSELISESIYCLISFSCKNFSSFRVKKKGGLIAIKET